MQARETGLPEPIAPSRVLLRLGAVPEVAAFVLILCGLMGRRSWPSLSLLSAFVLSLFLELVINPHVDLSGFARPQVRLRLNAFGYFSQLAGRFHLRDLADKIAGLRNWNKRNRP